MPIHLSCHLLSLLQISARGWRMLGSVIGGWVSDFVANSTLIQGILSTLTGLFDAFGATAGACMGLDNRQD